MSNLKEIGTYKNWNVEWTTMPGDHYHGGIGGLKDCVDFVRYTNNGKSTVTVRAGVGKLITIISDGYFVLSTNSLDEILDHAKTIQPR